MGSMPAAFGMVNHQDLPLSETQAFLICESSPTVPTKVRSLSVSDLLEKKISGGSGQPTRFQIRISFFHTGSRQELRGNRKKKWEGRDVGLVEGVGKKDQNPGRGSLPGDA